MYSYWSIWPFDYNYKLSMTLTGALMGFCNTCESLQIIGKDSTSFNGLCNICGSDINDKLIQHKIIYVSDIFDDDKNITNIEDNIDTNATISEKCQKCGHNEMFFYTMQLRSVDEGQTVFYVCKKCKSKYSVNT